MVILFMIDVYVNLFQAMGEHMYHLIPFYLFHLCLSLASVYVTNWINANQLPVHSLLTRWYGIIPATMDK